VANHTSWDNGWISSHKDWYQQDAAGNIIYPILGWTDVAQLNFTNTTMRKEMIRLMKYWIYTANCDGYRCDYSDGPPADFWKQAIDSLRNISTHKLLLMAEGTRSDHFASGFNYTFGFSFYTQMKSIFSVNQSVTNIDKLNASEYIGAGDGNRVVRYLTNHDVNSTDGSPLGLFGGISGSFAAFVVTAYMKGVPMIYNGQEVATSYPLYFTTTGKTITWNQNKGVLEEYKRIIGFRNQSNAVRRGDLVSYSNADVCAFTKTFGAEKVLVIVNLRNESLKFNLPGSIAGTVWKDAFSGIPASLNSQLSLPPYSYFVFSN